MRLWGAARRNKEELVMIVCCAPSWPDNSVSRVKGETYRNLLPSGPVSQI